MDWPRARAILLAAFLTVNLILAYSIWGPQGLFRGMGETSPQQRLEQVRAVLLERGIILPSTVVVPQVPGSMKFLHVEYGETPELVRWTGESSGRAIDRVDGLGRFNGLDGQIKPESGAETQTTVYRPAANGLAAREVKLDNRQRVEQVASEYLRQIGLMPQGAVFSDLFIDSETGNRIVEYVPHYDQYPVYSGHLRVEVSPAGIEEIRQFWVNPRGYTTAPAKAIRPADEALLRLAGRLEHTPTEHRVIQEVRLGYYANRSLTPDLTDEVQGWDTVPVWRISLDSGEVYYINAFNGEWES